MPEYTLKQQIEREFACMDYTLARAKIALEQNDYERFRGFMKATYQSFLQVKDLQEQLEVQERLKNLAEDMQSKGIQVHHLHYHFETKK